MPDFCKPKGFNGVEGELMGEYHYQGIGKKPPDPHISDSGLKVELILRWSTRKSYGPWSDECDKCGAG